MAPATSEPRATRPKRTRRGKLWLVFKILAGTTAGVLAAGAIVLHLDLAVTRRLVARVANAALRPVFRGRLTIEALGALGVGGFSGARVRIDDPRGQTVLTADGVHATVHGVELLRTLLDGSKTLEIVIPEASIDHADLSLDTDEEGVPLLAHAFTPAPSGPPSPPGAPPPKLVRLVIERARARHVWIHGLPTWGPPLDLEVADAEGKVTVKSTGSVEIDVRRGQLLARAVPIAGAGAGSLHGRVVAPSEHGNPVGITAAFEGALGGIEEKVRFSIDGDVVSATVDVKEAAPEKVRALVPDYPLQDLLTAHVDAHGTFPTLDVEARASLRGGGELATSGAVILSESRRASLHATLAAIDLRGLAPGLPASSLGASVDATLGLDEGANLTGAATIVSEGGTVGDQVLPAAEIHATFSSGPRGPREDGRVDAAVALRDPGVAGNVALHVYPKGRGFEVAFDGHARAPALDAIRRLRLPIRGSVAASARGVLRLDAFAIAADVDAHAEGLAQTPYVRVGTADGTARITGSVFAPRIDAQVHGASLELAGARADRVDVTAKGLARAPHVHVALAGGTLPDLQADADVDLARSPVLRDVRAAFSRAADHAELHADTVRFAPGGVTAERVTVDGLGGPVAAELRVAPGAIAVRATGTDVDAGRVARLAGLDGWCRSGVLAFDVAAAVHGASAEGHARVDLVDGSVYGLRGSSAHAELTLADRRLEGRARADVPELGSFEVVGANLQMGKEGAAALRSWERVWGSLDLKAILDMARLAALLPEGLLPVHVTRGQLEIAGKVKRDSASDDTPHVAVSARTTGLAVEAASGVDAPSPEAPPGATVRAAPRWRVEGIDLAVDARLDGESGFAEVAGRVLDATGPLLAVDAKSSAMPGMALLAAPGRARELLAGVAFDATLVVPRRNLATFPAALDLSGAAGELVADARVHGTLADPEIELRASLGEASSNVARFSFPVDFELSSRYARGHADARLMASTKRRGQVLDAEAHADGALLDAVAGPAVAPWKASGRAHLEGFPLGGVGALADRQVRGHISGDVVLDGFHDDARATLDLALPDLQIGEVDYKEARVHAALGARTLDATVRLDHGDGSAEAHAFAASSWGAALAPSVEPPLDLSLAVKSFRAETLLPFAHETLAELEGRLDGRAHLAFDPRAGKTELDGKVVLSHGKLELSSALGELHDAQATVVLTPDGVLRIEDASASGVTGSVHAAASARLSAGKDGIVLGGARARVEIPRRSPLPVTLEGSPLGTIDGTLDVREDPTPDQRGMIVAIDVPTLHVQLPASGSRSLQPLGELADADVGAHRDPARARELVLVPLGPPAKDRTRAAGARRIEITTHLGRDVEVKRGTDLRVSLEGQPVVTLTDRLHVSGQIQLRKGGVLDVQGKSFEIERGTVTFVGDDPENPQVVVTAGWSAPDGTRIYADYVGPLKTGKVTLRSEPPLAQTDIVALLLFGTVESSSGGSGSQSATNNATGSAVGAAGGVATQPINHALDQFGVHAVAARVDTSQAANPKPEVELQIAKDISVQLAVVLGTPPPGSNPDTTLLTLNWRLLRGLTVATTVGNSGSSIVDMVWERRY